jgi:CheY-like chemotaxis protein
VRALVVDDVAENRDVLARMLGRIGAAVECVHGGEEALAAAARGAPDIVFMDMRMPGLGGEEARARMAAAAARAGRPVKFVAVSASVLAHERERCLRAGFDAFIEKPVSFAAVCGCLERLLGARLDSEAAAGGDEAGDLSAAELRELALPAALFDALTEALAAHDMSRSRRLLDHVEETGAAGRRLARHMRALGRRYDMPAMLAVLKEVRHG